MSILAHRIRLEPNNVQRSAMMRYAGAARFAFNFGLARWLERRAEGVRTSWQSINTELNARKAVEFPWTDAIPWRVLSAGVEDMGAAFSHFFRRLKDPSVRKKGHPRFKSKKLGHGSFCIEGRAIVVDGKRIRIPKLGWLRMSEPIRFPGRIRSARFTERGGHWHVSLQVEIDESLWSYPHRCETQAAVGIDLGVVDLAVLSTGERTDAPRALRAHQQKLRRLSKQLSRRITGGKNWQKTRLAIGRLHGHIANVRRDVTHKLTASLVRRFRFIGVEDLNVAGMARTRLAKSVMDAALSEVLRQLDYKAQLAGSVVVRANRFYPSSKMCSACGALYAGLSLSERRWTCEQCGTRHDRDENAAHNLKALAESHSATACRHGSAGGDHTVAAQLPLGQESGSLISN